MKTKEIFTYGLAKLLLSKGHKIVDLGYDKKHKRQIFIFEVDEFFIDDFSKLQDNFKKI